MLKKPKYFSRGQQSGDFSPEKLLGAQKTEHFPGVIVQPLLDLFDFPGRDLAQVGALRDVPPDEAETVRRIFREYLSGKGIGSIANGLNADGVRTRYENAWSSEAVTLALCRLLDFGAIWMRAYRKPISLSQMELKSTRRSFSVVPAGDCWRHTLNVVSFWRI